MEKCGLRFLGKFGAGLVLAKRKICPLKCPKVWRNLLMFLCLILQRLPLIAQYLHNEHNLHTSDVELISKPLQYWDRCIVQSIFYYCKDQSAWAFHTCAGVALQGRDS